MNDFLFYPIFVECEKLPTFFILTYLRYRTLSDQNLTRAELVQLKNTAVRLCILSFVFIGS